MALKKVGALWKKTDKKGNEFYSGMVDLGMAGEANVMVFHNEKAEDKHPDMVVHLVSNDKDD